MKASKIAILSLFIILLTFKPVMATPVVSTITDVTIYSQGATVTRTANVNLIGGENKIVFIDLPTSINLRGLQVEIADSGVNLGQVSLKNIQSREVKDSEVANLSDRIEVLNRSIVALEDGSRAAALQLKFLESLANGYAKDAWVNTAQANADVQGWRQALTIMQSGSDAAYKKIRENTDKVKELNKDKSVLRRTLADLKKGILSSKSLLAHVAAEGEVSTQIQISYFQENAGWSSVYEARLNSDSGHLVLSQKAVIEQYTGENWENVKVTLSTSKPDEELQAPTMESSYLSLQRQYKKQAYTSAKPSVASAGVLEEIIVTGAMRADTWSGSYALSFPIAGRVNVLSNAAEEQSYDLEKYPLQAELITQIVPRSSTNSFLVARFNYRGKLPLFGSDLLVYVDGVLMGTADMPTILPGAEVALPMGQDRRIEVNVIDQGGNGGASGIMKKQRVEATDLVFEVINRRGTTTTVEVKDLYPIPRDRAIKVVRGKNATLPDEENVDDEVGIVLWRKQMQANETWRIYQNYTISYPANRDLIRE